MDIIPSVYWWGMIGSLAIEVSAAARIAGMNGGVCPDNYKRPFYLIARALLAFVSGLLAVVLDAPNGWAAFYIGASAPVLLDRAAQGLEPESK